MIDENCGLSPHQIAAGVDTWFGHCRWRHICVHWTAAGHCQGEDADVSYSLQERLPVLHVDGEAGGHRTRAVRRHRAQSHGTSVGECRPLHGIRSVSETCRVCLWQNKCG